MLLNDICSGLHKNGHFLNFYSEKNRVYINDKNEFNEYLLFENDGGIFVKVYLKDKKHGEEYSKEDWVKIFRRKNYIISLLNSLNLGVTFNSKGELEYVNE